MNWINLAPIDRMKILLTPELFQLVEDKSLEVLVSMIQERASQFSVLNLETLYTIGFAKHPFVECLGERLEDPPPGTTHLGNVIRFLRDNWNFKPRKYLLGDSNDPRIIEKKFLENGNELLTLEIKFN